MADYWLTQDILGAIGTGFIVFLVVALGMAILIPKDRNLKIILCGVIALFAVAIGGQGVREYRDARVAAEKYREKLAKATALFEERCKSSGERIYRTVNGVRGVFLINMRTRVNPEDQFDMNDPAGDGASGSHYVQTFLMGRHESPDNPHLLTSSNRNGAFEFVETSAKGGEGFIRYRDRRGTANDKPAEGQLLTEESTDARQARYGIEWSDLSSREERLHWIAGSRIRILDMDSKEVLAERIGYILDRGLGSTAGGRQPWSFALQTACPSFPRLHGQYADNVGLSRNFAERVLKRD